MVPILVVVLLTRVTNHEIIGVIVFWIAAWITFIILSREIAITGLRDIVSEEGMTVQATLFSISVWFQKIKTSHLRLVFIF